MQNTLHQRIDLERRNVLLNTKRVRTVGSIAAAVTVSLAAIVLGMAVF